MKIKLVKIGNSAGVRLPKNVIQECNFQDELDLIVQEKTVLLRASQEDRTAWYELFKEGVRQRPIRDKGEWEW